MGLEFSGASFGTDSKNRQDNFNRSPRHMVKGSSRTTVLHHISTCTTIDKCHQQHVSIILLQQIMLPWSHHLEFHNPDHPNPNHTTAKSTYHGYRPVFPHPTPTQMGEKRQYLTYKLCTSLAYHLFAFCCRLIRFRYTGRKRSILASILWNSWGTFILERMCYMEIWNICILFLICHSPDCYLTDFRRLLPLLQIRVPQAA